MRLIILLCVLFLCVSAHAYYENIQDDWSGGPLVQSPDWEFGNTFSSSDSLHWQTPDTLLLEEYGSGYPQSGELISQIIILPIPTDNIIWGDIFWFAETPSGTSVEFDIRVSKNWEQMGDWYGPFTETTDLATVLPIDVDYLQYRAVLTTDNSDSTPLLFSVTITGAHADLTDMETERILDFSAMQIIRNPAPGGSFEVILTEESTVSIYSLSGRLVVEVTRSSEVCNLPPGIYTCVCAHAGRTETQRVVVLK